MKSIAAQDILKLNIKEINNNNNKMGIKLSIWIHHFNNALKLDYNNQSVMWAKCNNA